MHMSTHMHIADASPNALHAGTAGWAAAETKFFFQSLSSSISISSSAV